MSIRLDSEDPAVDELKRRARRRLVGAIVFALAAAVILPLLLESEPKPFGDDISIQIPPVDSGKFVSGLSSGQTATDKAKSDGKPSSKAGSSTPVPSESTPTGAPAPRPSLAEAEQRVLGQAGLSNPPASAVPAPTSAQPSAASTVESKPAVPPQPKPELNKDKNDGKTLAKTEPQGASNVSDAFVVQLAAFADVKAARELAAHLKKAGFPGYTEPLTTSQGTMQRVRVGPYASREEADAALANLRAAGYSNAIVSSAK